MNVTASAQAFQHPESGRDARARRDGPYRLEHVAADEDVQVGLGATGMVGTTAADNWRNCRHEHER